jgi:HEAT repeat protein
LAKISGRNIEDWLKDLDDPDKYTRATALETLSDALFDVIFDDQELLDLLTSHFKRKLEDGSSLVQMTAIDALGKVSQQFPELVTDIVPFLKDFLKAEDHYIWEGTLELIGEIGAKDPQVVREIVPDIITLTESDDPNIREKAAESIAKILSTDAPLRFNDLQEFANILLCPKLELRKRVLPMLAPKFVNLLVDLNNFTRNQTMDFIQSLCNKDLTLIREFVPFLIEKLADQNAVSLTIQALLELLPLIRQAMQS